MLRSVPAVLIFVILIGFCQILKSEIVHFLPDVRELMGTESDFLILVHTLLFDFRVSIASCH